MASEPVRSTAVVAAPKDYSIPNAQQIRVLSVRAAFTDNGAGGDWLPALQLLDNNGNVLVTAADQGVKVTAGSDADVSWFPGLKAAASGAAGSVARWIALWKDGSTTLNVGAGATVNLVCPNSLGGDTVLDSPNSWKVRINNGPPTFALIHATAKWDVLHVPGSINIAPTTSFNSGLGTFQPDFHVLSNESDINGNNGFPQNFTWMHDEQMFVGNLGGIGTTTVSVTVTNEDVVPHAIDMAMIGCYAWSL